MHPRDPAGQDPFEPGPNASVDGEPQTPPRFDTAGVGPGATPVKADLTKRFVAAIIDGVVAGVVSLVPVAGGLVAAAYLLLRDGLELDFMDRRSIGKKVMKLRPVTASGVPMDMALSARRNWMFALGGLISVLAWIPILGWLLIIPVALAALGIALVELFLVLTDPAGRRLGDKMADTTVIEVAN